MTFMMDKDIGTPVHTTPSTTRDRDGTQQRTGYIQRDPHKTQNLLNPKTENASLLAREDLNTFEVGTHSLGGIHSSFLSSVRAASFNGTPVLSESAFWAFGRGSID